MAISVRVYRTTSVFKVSYISTNEDHQPKRCVHSNITLKEYNTLLTSDCYLFLFAEFSGERKHEKSGGEMRS